MKRHVVKVGEKNKWVNRGAEGERRDGGKGGRRRLRARKDLQTIIFFPSCP